MRAQQTSSNGDSNTKVDVIIASIYSATAIVIAVVIVAGTVLIFHSVAGKTTWVNFNVGIAFSALLGGAGLREIAYRVQAKFQASDLKRLREQVSNQEEIRKLLRQIAKQKSKDSK